MSFPRTARCRWGSGPPSPDGSLLAYTLSEGGADWQTVKVRTVATGQDLSDDVRWMRFSDLSWTQDGQGFFYSRYPEPPKNKVLEAALANHALYYHRVGTPQSQDVLVYARKDLPEWTIVGSVSEDGRYLFVLMYQGADNRNRLYYADLGNPMAPKVTAPIRPLDERGDAEYLPFGTEWIDAVGAHRQGRAESCRRDHGAGRRRGGGVEDDRAGAERGDRERGVHRWPCRGPVPRGRAEPPVDVRRRWRAARRRGAARHRHGGRLHWTRRPPGHLVRVHLTADPHQ